MPLTVACAHTAHLKTALKILAGTLLHLLSSFMHTGHFSVEYFRILIVFWSQISKTTREVFTIEKENKKKSVVHGF